MPYRLAGDYMRGYRGDPGLFSFIGKAVKKVGGAALNLLPGPIGAVGRTVAGALGSRTSPAPQPLRAPPSRATGKGIDVRGPFGMGFRIGPGAGGPPPPSGGGGGGRKKITVDAETGLPARRRRMNVANPRALRRAIRRQSGFVKLARRALKGSGYKIVSSGTSRRTPLRVQESGPGGVTIQR